MFRNVCLLFVAATLSFAVCAGDALKITDSAKTSVKKTPVASPLGPAIEALAGKSTIQIVIPAPGVDAATFNASTQIKVVISESGSSDYFLDLTFGKDPKYTPGAKSVKIDQKDIAGVPGRVTLRLTQVKIGKDEIVISIKNNVNSLYTQTFLNYGTFNIVKYPEGSGTGSKTFTVEASVGTFAKTFTSVKEDITYTNKKKIISGSTYWTGNAKGTASVQ
ncbi:MAG TPA: hypothetical protein VEK08_19590 [Planctomycetota bacterium]|nr:hypothetical protein [Planctomycetota bacterium]